MIAFRPMSLRERVLRAVSLSYRRRRDDETLAALRELCRDPSLPCMVGDVFIPNGHGPTKEEAAIADLRIETESRA